MKMMKIGKVADLLGVSIQNITSRYATPAVWEKRFDGFTKSVGRDG